MTIKEIQDQVVEEFSFFDEWDEKYSYIIDLGKKLDTLDEQLKTDDKIIKGCQSRVWLNSYLKDGKVVFEADSDAIIVKGLVYLLVRVLSDQKPSDIISTPIDFMDRIGMQQHLSPTRSNGLASMLKQMKLDALAYQAKASN